MKPTTVPTIHHLGTSEAEVQMSIDQKSIVHIMTLLTDLYSDRVMAVIREYSTNAHDANIEAGNTSPIEVTLPTQIAPEFVVKDQGVGLSTDEILNVYSMYGASTKRESDLVNGMLGLGCKSGLTYTNTFTVTAVKNGVRTIASVSKDNEGGAIKILDTAATLDPNGVTIKIPVEVRDCTQFADKAANFYRYWPVGTVLVNGEEPDRSYFKDAIWLDEDVCVLNQPHQSKLVMGNVAYPLVWPNHMFEHSVVARVPIGSVHFTPSREALMDSPLTDDTRQTILEYVLERFPYALRDQIRKRPTPFHQARILNAWRHATRRVTKGALSEFRGTLEVSHERNRTTWAYSRISDTASKSRADWRLVNDEEGFLIVTEFPYKAVGQTHRLRLKDLQGWYGPGTPNPGGMPRSILVVPDGANIEVLEGRANVIAWDDVLAITATPSKAAVAATRNTTTYIVTQNKTRSHKEQLDPKDGPIVMRLQRPVTRRSVYDRTPADPNDKIAARYPEAQLLSLYQRQIDRFKRLHPTAVMLEDYDAKQKAAAEKALTADDRLALSLKDDPWIDTWTRVGLLEAADDPDMKKIAAMKKHAVNSKTMARAKALGVTVETKNDICAKVKIRYPLLTTTFPTPHKRDRDDWLLYINAKFKSTQPKPTEASK